MSCAYYNKRSELHKVYKDSQQDIDNSMFVLSSALNAVHCTNHGNRYWNIIIRSWLEYIVENFHHHKMMSDNCNYLHSKQLSFHVANGFLDFERQVCTIEWKDELSVLIGFLNNNNNINGSDLLKSDISYQVISNSIYKKTMLIFLFFIKKIVPENRIISTTIFSPSLFLSCIFKLHLLPVPAIYVRDISTTTINPEMREKLYRSGEFNAKGVLSDTLWKLVCATIPLSYLEDYHRLVNHSYQKYGKPTRIVLSHNLHSPDSYKVWIANSVENNTKLVGVQHGGGFGIVFYDYLEVHETDISDIYLSWFSSTNQKNIQVPSPKKIQWNRKVGRKSVVLVNVAYPSFYKYLSCPIMEQTIQNIDDQIVFLKLLDRSVIPCMSVRQYPHNYDLPIQDKYKDSGLINLVDKESSYNKLISTANLIVLSYMGTTWLEALMSNIPTIVFVNPDHWDMKQEIYPYLDKLKNVGILHDTPISAANHINNIFPDIDAWWNNLSLQLVREEFCQNFAYTEKKWAEKWTNAIQTILD